MKREKEIKNEYPKQYWKKNNVSIFVFLWYLEYNEIFLENEEIVSESAVGVWSMTLKNLGELCGTV
jgi:hypothetical protein